MAPRVNNQIRTAAPGTDSARLEAYYTQPELWDLERFDADQLAETVREAGLLPLRTAVYHTELHPLAGGLKGWLRAARKRLALIFHPHARGKYLACLASKT